MNNPKKCRYCGEIFDLKPGKPGLATECPACLHEKTHPPIPKDFKTRYFAGYPKRKKAYNDLVKQVLAIGGTEEMAQELMIKMMGNERTKPL